MVYREHPFRQLDELGDHTVTWISSPAGAGKTTLVASHLYGPSTRSLWYRLDETDRDVTCFFYYIAEAGRMKPPYAVVFDNYQDVPEETAFHEVIKNLVKSVPDAANISVGSKTSREQWRKTRACRPMPGIALAKGPKRSRMCVIKTLKIRRLHET